MWGNWSTTIPCKQTCSIGIAVATQGLVQLGYGRALLTFCQSVVPCCEARYSWWPGRAGAEPRWCDLGFERRVWLDLCRACAEPCGLVLLIMIGPLAISAATATSTPDSKGSPRGFDNVFFGFRNLVFLCVKDTYDARTCAHVHAHVHVHVSCKNSSPTRTTICFQRGLAVSVASCTCTRRTARRSAAPPGPTGGPARARTRAGGRARARAAAGGRGQCCKSTRIVDINTSIYSYTPILSVLYYSIAKILPESINTPRCIDTYLYCTY